MCYVKFWKFLKPEWSLYRGRGILVFTLFLCIHSTDVPSIPIYAPCTLYAIHSNIQSPMFLNLFTWLPFPFSLDASLYSMLANTPILASRLTLSTPGLVLHMRRVFVRGGSSIRRTRSTLSSFLLFFLLANGVFKVVDGAVVIEDAAKGLFGKGVLVSVGMPGHCG